VFPALSIAYAINSSCTSHKYVTLFHMLESAHHDIGCSRPCNFKTGVTNEPDADAESTATFEYRIQ